MPLCTPERPFVWRYFFAILIGVERFVPVLEVSKQLIALTSVLLWLSVPLVT